MSTQKPFKTEWDLKLFYTNEHDPHIERDIAQTTHRINAFAKKYKNKDFTSSEEKLLKALKDFEALSDDNGLLKVVRYFAFRRELDARDTQAEARLAKLSSLSAQLSNELTFFELAIGNISKKLQKKYLTSTRLKEYSYFLKQIFENAQFNLTEPEEKILTLKSQPSRSMWISGFERLLNKQTVSFKSKDIPFPEAMGKVRTLKTKERRKLHTLLMQKLYDISDFAESEINAIVTNKKINDELRGYTTPFEATVRGYENDPKTLEVLRKSVSACNKISHRFYKAKAKLLKEDKLTYADRGASVGKVEKKISFKEAIQIVEKEFRKAHPTFGEIFQNMLQKGQIDVYPKAGKSGGAFCAGSHNLPTLVLLNQTDDFNSLTTLAHEMGHAIHTELSKKQPVLYEDYTIASAEVASTFFEALIFDSIFENATEKEKVVLLHNKIQDDVSTIFRQMACFEFELELHNTIRDQGFLPKEDIARMMNKHMKKYLGSAFDLDDLDGYFFVNWSHIRNFFYVYSYAFGQIISAALYAKYKEDPRFIDKVIKFLSAGGSMSPEDIFKSIGIDVTKPDFFETGLKQIEKQVKELEKLVKKQ